MFHLSNYPAVALFPNSILVCFQFRWSGTKPNRGLDAGSVIESVGLFPEIYGVFYSAAQDKVICPVLSGS